MMAAFGAPASAQPPPRNNFLALLVRPAASGQVPDEEPLISYLESTVSGQFLDLVVAVGGPAAAFVRTHRERLFPTTPILNLHSTCEIRTSPAA